MSTYALLHNMYFIYCDTWSISTVPDCHVYSDLSWKIKIRYCQFKYLAIAAFLNVVKGTRLVAVAKNEYGNLEMYLFASKYRKIVKSTYTSFMRNWPAPSLTAPRHRKKESL